MRKTYELLREGVPSRDGRTVAAGAATWPEHPLPVMGYDDNGTFREDGMVANIRRVGQYIYGDCNRVLPEGKCLTVGGWVGDDFIQTEQHEFIATTFEIKYANVSDQAEYPWDD